jgi:AP2 domain/HNH endonuclease
VKLALKHGWCLIDDTDWRAIACDWAWRSQRSSVRGSNGQKLQSAYVVGHPLDDKHGLDLEMHRLILGLPQYRELKIDVDHINGDGLDNRRANLRIATRAQNLANSGSRQGSSQYKGVSFCRQTGRWKAQITIGGQNHNLGRYSTEEEAAAVYNAAALEAWGEHAHLNVI